MKLDIKKSLSNKLRTIVSIVVPVVALVFGVFIYLARYAYYEDGHNIILMVYIAGCLLLFWGLRRMSLALIALCLLVMIGSQVYAAQKFNWRQNYIESAMAGSPFLLEEMITTYPTYEQYMFPFLKHPNWVGFANDCVQPALNNMSLGQDCGSPEAIMARYNIDIMSEMALLAGKMRNTAQLLEAGKLEKRSQYIACIAQKSCATIPLLPKGVDASEMDPLSKDYIEIRQAFWSLVKDKKLSPETCKLTPVCQALMTMGVIKDTAIPF